MNNVIDLKGNPVEPPKELPAPPASPSPDAMPSSAEVLIAAFFAAVAQMSVACNSPDIDLSKASFRDDKGTVYSAPAVMRIIDRHMNFIRLKMGAEYKPANNNPTNPRR